MTVLSEEVAAIPVREREASEAYAAEMSKLRTSVGKAVAVLGAFQCTGGAMLGVSQVAERANLSKSTAHRILAVLVENGYVERSTEGEVGALLAANGCQGTGQSQAQGTLTTTRWTSCGSGDPVELDLYQGDVHQWPAGDAATPSAQQMVWNFFRSIPEEHR